MAACMMGAKLRYRAANPIPLQQIKSALNAQGSNHVCSNLLGIGALIITNSMSLETMMGVGAGISNAFGESLLTRHHTHWELLLL